MKKFASITLVVLWTFTTYALVEAKKASPNELQKLRDFKELLPLEAGKIGLLPLLTRVVRNAEDERKRKRVRPSDDDENEKNRRKHQRARKEEEINSNNKRQRSGNPKKKKVDRIKNSSPDNKKVSWKGRDYSNEDISKEKEKKDNRSWKIDEKSSFVNHKGNQDSSKRNNRKEHPNKTKGIKSLQEKNAINSKKKTNKDKSSEKKQQTKERNNSQKEIKKIENSSSQEAVASKEKNPQGIRPSIRTASLESPHSYPAINMWHICWDYKKVFTLSYTESTLIYGASGGGRSCRVTIKTPNGTKVGFYCPIFMLSDDGCKKENLFIKDKRKAKKWKQFCRKKSPNGPVLDINKSVIRYRSSVSKAKQQQGVFVCQVYPYGGLTILREMYAELQEKLNMLKQFRDQVAEIRKFFNNFLNEIGPNSKGERQLPEISLLILVKELENATSYRKIADFNLSQSQIPSLFEESLPVQPVSHLDINVYAGIKHTTDLNDTLTKKIEKMSKRLSYLESLFYPHQKVPPPIDPLPVVTAPALVITTSVPVVTTPAPVTTAPAPVVTTPMVTTPIPVAATPVPTVTTLAPAGTTPLAVITTPVPVITNKPTLQ